MAIHTKFFKSKLQETTTITFNNNDKDNDNDNDNNNKDTSIYFSMLPDYDHGDINVVDVIDDETKKCIIFKCFSVVEDEDEESSPSYEYDLHFPH